MRSRFVYAVAAVFALAGVATAQPPSPAVVVQTKPISRLLTDFKEILRQIGGPEQGMKMVKDFENDLKRSLGEQGFEGLDINRPIAAYAVLKDRPEDCGLVLVVPVTTEKEFLAFLERSGIKTEAVKDKKGVFTLDMHDHTFPKDSHVRFNDNGWAYLTLNDGEPTDAKNLVAVGDLLDNTDQSLASVKVFPGRIPAKLVAKLLDELDQTANTLKMFFAAGPGGEAKVLSALLEQGPKLLRRYAETGIKEANEIGAKVSFDAMNGDIIVDAALVPKPGTDLAKEIAAIKPTTNRFAGLVTKDAAVSVLFKAPLFAKELREIGGAIFEGIEKELKGGDVPEKLRPIVVEGLKGIGRTVKSDDLDAAFVIHGPNADGKITMVAAMSLNDAAAIEKAVRALGKDSDFSKDFEFDVAKVGDVGIHKVPLTRLLPEGNPERRAKIFGEKPVGAVAFAKDAVFLAFGAEAVDRVKAALEAKPTAAPAFDVTVNAGRLHKLVAGVDPKDGETFAKYMGKADKNLAAVRLTIDGGTKLTGKLTLNTQVVPRVFLLGENASGTFEKVGEPIK
ncbi:MAG: hypothetical protein U0792_20800 [Gemmataceae bacterium]